MSDGAGLVLLYDGGDCLVVRWRPGSVWSGEEAEAWLRERGGRPRAPEEKGSTVLLDRSSSAGRVVRCLQRLEISGQLGVTDHTGVRRELRPRRRSSRAEGISEKAAAR